MGAYSRGDYSEVGAYSRIYGMRTRAYRVGRLVKKMMVLDVRTFWMTPRHPKVEKTLHVYPRNYGLNAPMELNEILKFLGKK